MKCAVAESMNLEGSIRYDCCVDAAMAVIEGRWKCTILCMLYRDGPMRYSELQRSIGEVSSRILSKQLKELESDGMIERTVGNEKKLCVIYELTEKGRSILPILADLAGWGARHQMMQIITTVSDDQNISDKESRMVSPNRRPRCFYRSLPFREWSFHGI